MNKLAFVALLAIALTSSACQTIYFQNDARESTQVGEDQLYHLWLFGAVDSSGSVNLERECGGNDWRTVKTELSVLSGAIRLLTAPIYTPWGVAWECAER